MDIKDKQEANKIIVQKLNAALNLIRECESIADEFETTFSLSLEYGMGGTYYPVKRDDIDGSGYYDTDEMGWISSSVGC